MLTAYIILGVLLTLAVSLPLVIVSLRQRHHYSTASLAGETFQADRRRMAAPVWDREAA